ncbi:metalloregulator ArsR/SmtB family transcription factor [Ochrobactrum sp. Marseille-Q0166]|uniref:ArsR/SmtB family transcription factor n=1 Tax=Ochrobactrum sp. Marseille-Q0166 TaxID=2761105 RepID=UPI0016559695|nr:metalloregulator ArsR/SmtB family transcription factor [Ochrobactrum sp. Marseille-Q0166]MBC8718502.1 helix-turn-helix transcriptional regulator [Ochrobactrum sp. Marseille-Q0166]
MKDTDPIDAGLTSHSADKASDFLKAIANNHRLMILCRLTCGERSVGQLAEMLGLRDSTVSQHLALLRRDGIIAGRRDGQTIWYRIESDAAREVMAVLYSHFRPPTQSSAQS